MNDSVLMGRIGADMSDTRNDGGSDDDHYDVHDGKFSAILQETGKWIEMITKEKLRYPLDFLKSLQDGVILCKLLNSLKRGCIKKINMMQTPVAYLDNLSLFQNVCRQEFNMQDCQLFDIRDLDDLDIRGTIENQEEFVKETVKRINKVLVTIYWLSRCSPDYPPLKHDHTFICSNPASSSMMTSKATATSISSNQDQQQLTQHATQLPGKYSAKSNNIDDKTKWQNNEIDWEKNFSAWKTKRMSQFSSSSTPSPVPASTSAAGAGDRGFNDHNGREYLAGEERHNGSGLHFNGGHHQHHHSEQLHHHHQHVNKHASDEVFDKAPALPKWDTYPGFKNADDDDTDDDEEEDIVKFHKRPATNHHKGKKMIGSFSSMSSSSSSSSSSSPLVREYRSADNVNKVAADRTGSGFEKLLIDVNKLSHISLSQSLKDLENFDEVGFDEDYQIVHDDDGCDKNSEVETIAHDKDEEDKYFSIRNVDASDVELNMFNKISSTDDDNESEEEEEEDDDDNKDDDNSNDDKENVISAHSDNKRKPLNFIGELIQLNEATKKFDGVFEQRTVTSNDADPRKVLTTSNVHNMAHLSRNNDFLSVTTEQPLNERFVATKSLPSPSPSVSSSSSLPSTTSLSLFNSKMYDRFYHDMNAIMNSNAAKTDSYNNKNNNKVKKLDLESEKRRIVEWNMKCDRLLQERFMRDRVMLKEKLEEDMRKADETERLRKIKEEEFLENEVIEVKNKKTLSNSDNDYCSFGQLRNGSKSKPLSFFSYQVLSDYGSPSLDHHNLKKQSFFHGPSSHSLTHDWLMNSCVETCRPEDGAQTEDDTKNAGCLVGDQVLPGLSTGDDNFDEPTWMKYVTDEVNKQSINMPLTTATLEIVSDSLNGSSENISAIQSNEDSIETPARNISLDHFSTPHRAANQLNYLQDISKASFSTPPSETKTSSTSYQNSTLLSKDSVPSHLTSISAKTLSSPSLPEPSAPSSATIVRSGVSLLPLKVNISSSLSSHSSNALLTPSSERCLEVCYLNPPPKVLKKKLSDSEDNISFSSSRSSATYRQSLSTPSTIPSSTPQYLYCDHNISSSVDHLFAYHDGIARKQYCVVDSTHQTNHARICELPVKNLSEDKSSCSACGFCIGSGKSVKMFSLIGHYHVECFCCFICKEPVDGIKQQLHMNKSIIMCDECYKKSLTHRRKN